MSAVSVVTDAKALAALWPDWAGLWRHGAGLPFLSPDWLAPWWAVFGTGAPVVAVLRDDAALLGVLPLYRLGDRLLPMGVGPSDYFDALLAPETPPDSASRLLAAALAAGGVARCDLPELPPGAHLLTADVPGWQASAWSGPPCPVLALQPAPEIPAGMRRDIRQAGHRGARAGCTIERADAATLAPMLEALIHLHGARWHSRDEPGVLADPLVLDWHRRAAPGLLAAGQLRLEVLRLREKVAAATYALLGGGNILFYLGGFDPACRFESPGVILLGHMIAAAAAEGFREAHFLRGSEAYKYAWGAIDRPNTGRTLMRP